MIMRKNKRWISLYIEWKEEDQTDALYKMLFDKGICDIEIDEDVDIEDYPFPGIKHEHTVFRLFVGDDFPVWRILTDVAMHPGVFSVGEI